MSGCSLRTTSIQIGAGVLVVVLVIWSSICFCLHRSLLLAVVWFSQPRCKLKGSCFSLSGEFGWFSVFFRPTLWWSSATGQAFAGDFWWLLQLCTALVSCHQFPLARLFTVGVFVLFCARRRMVWFVFVLLCFCFVLLVFVDVSGSEIGWYCGFLTRKGLVLLTRKGRSNVLDSSHDLGSSASFLWNWLCWCSCAFCFSDVPGLLRSAGLKASGVPLFRYRLLIRLCSCDCSRIV
jgi:hypothetical protein